MKLLKDILRDKGSTKYSITKTLAVLFSMILTAYLIYYLGWLKTSVDHTLVVELIGLIGALVGLKNNWGVSKKSTIDSEGNRSHTTEMDMRIEPKNNDDESVF